MESPLVCPTCGAAVTGSPVRNAGFAECLDCGSKVPLKGSAPSGNPPAELPADRPSRKPLEPVHFNSKHGNVIDDEMDMTPMVDVTFLLLIFFMVTAAFSLQRAFEVPAPDPQQPSTAQAVEIDEDPDFVTVRVDAYNTYFVSTSEWEEEAPSEQELRVRLREAVRGNSQGVTPSKMLVKAHGDALHEKVVTALDAGAELGMQEVKLTTVEEDD